MKSIILAGGSGSRLYPLSRSNYPKQFLPTQSGRSFFQETILRLDGDIIVVTAQATAHLCARQSDMLSRTGTVSFLSEPCARNTAPAILFALTRIADDDVVAIFPSDHIIRDEKAFRAALHHAEKSAEAGNICVFGIIPSRPETGYGYIECGERVNDSMSRVQRFVEKPDITHAEQFLKSGLHFWNAGIFVSMKKTLLKEVQRCAPDLYTWYCALCDARENIQELYQKAPSIAIDVAVMEKTDKAVVIPVNIGWSDVGSWVSYKEMWEQENVVQASENLLVDTHNVFVHSPKKTVAVIGIDNCVCIDTDDVLLLCNLDRTQDVKKIAAVLERNKETSTQSPMYDERPWGRFEVIGGGVGYKVKKIIVYAGERLSLQYHNKREEFWTIVRGKGSMILGEREFAVSEGEVIHIPVSVPHRISAETEIEFIEVQRGEYLGEDDIVRLNDSYGRV